MIKKLRHRYTLAAVLSLFLVLAVIMAVVNILNYRNVVDNADTVLDILSENGGAFPKLPDFRSESGESQASSQGDTPPELPEDWQDWEQRWQEDARRGERQFRERMEFFQRNPELQFETRFFSVVYDGTGARRQVNVGMIAAVDEAEAWQFGARALAAGADRGFVRDFRYARSAFEGGTLIIFLDCGRTLGSFRTFLLWSIVISLGALGLVCLLMMFLSGRIVRPIAETYEKQRRFITDAGHEIKTPIAIISADAEVIELENGESEWTGDIKAQTKRLAALTDDLIFLSRMEETDSRPAMLPFSFSDLVSDCASGFEAPARTQGKSFEKRIAPGLEVTGDEKGLRQLTNILLDNAVKYSPEGGRISLTAESFGTGVRLTVENTAENITREQLERMFDRFYRGDSSRSQEKTGYGIGLSIARAVADAHRGKIAASSPDGKTMKITFILPQNKNGGHKA